MSEFKFICMGESLKHPNEFSIFANIKDNGNGTVDVDRYMDFGKIHVGVITLAKEDFKRYYKPLEV